MVARKLLRLATVGDGGEGDTAAAEVDGIGVVISAREPVKKQADFHPVRNMSFRASREAGLIQAIRRIADRSGEDDGAECADSGKLCRTARQTYPRR